MSAILSESIQEQISGFRTVADLHPLVIARLVVEWARIDRDFPMKLWGAEMLGTHVTVGSDRWLVGRMDKGPVPIFTVTQEVSFYAGFKGQKTWKVQLADLQANGCGAKLEAM